MMDDLVLLPRPQQVHRLAGVCRLTVKQVEDIKELYPGSGGVLVRLDPCQMARPQQYRLVIRPKRIMILAHDEGGVQHAAVTLRQIARQAGRSLPCLRIEDWPDFRHRGYMLDISRDKVPTMQTLFAIVDLLAELKFNQLQLYTEHTFAYEGHRDVWKNASPMTPFQVQRLDTYCQQQGIELVPNQNSFGHMERWLRHERYRTLAEAPDGFITPWGERRGPSTLCPTDPRSLRLVRGLYDQLLKHFTSRQVNIGCDETWDLGQGRSKALCEKVGAGRVYLEFLCKLHDVLAKQWRTVQFWGDIILKHPELIDEAAVRMPAAIALEWGYEATHPFAEHCPKFAESGMPFYVCPGTSTWMSLCGRLENALGNLRSAAENGLKHGAIGYLVTDWGDMGHMQPLAASFLPLAYGAAVSWNFAGNRDIDLAAAADLHVFRDSAGLAGQAAMDLGNAYLKTGVLVGNSTVLAQALCHPPDAKRDWLEKLEASKLRQTAAYIAEAAGRFSGAKIQRADGRAIIDEMQLGADMMIHGANLLAERLGAADRSIGAIPADVRGRLAAELAAIIERYQAQWLIRNRHGGLVDSLARLRKLLAAYA